MDVKTYQHMNIIDHNLGLFVGSGDLSIAKKMVNKSTNNKKKKFRKKNINANNRQEFFETSDSDYEDDSLEEIYESRKRKEKKDNFEDHFQEVWINALHKAKSNTPVYLNSKSKSAIDTLKV